MVKESSTMMKLDNKVAFFVVLSVLFHAQLVSPQELGGANNHYDNNTRALILNGITAPRIDGFVVASLGGTRCGGQLIYFDIVVSYCFH